MYNISAEHGWNMHLITSLIFWQNLSFQQVKWDSKYLNHFWDLHNNFNQHFGLILIGTGSQVSDVAHGPLVFIIFQLFYPYR